MDKEVVNKIKSILEEMELNTSNKTLTESFKQKKSEVLYCNLLRECLHNNIPGQVAIDLAEEITFNNKSTSDLDLSVLYK